VSKWLLARRVQGTSSNSNSARNERACSSCASEASGAATLTRHCVSVLLCDMCADDCYAPSKTDRLASLGRQRPCVPWKRERMLLLVCQCEGHQAKMTAVELRRRRSACGSAPSDNSVTCGGRQQRS
jgi:hypothetical protein